MVKGGVRVVVVVVVAYASAVLGLAALLSADTVKPSGNQSNREYAYTNIVQPLITCALSGLVN